MGKQTGRGKDGRRALRLLPDVGTVILVLGVSAFSLYRGTDPVRVGAILALTYVIYVVLANVWPRSWTEETEGPRARRGRD